MVILDKLITDLKSKLPLKKAKSQNDELDEIDDERTDPSRDMDRTNITDVKEVEDDTPPSNSIVDKLKDKIKGLNKPKGQAADDASDEAEEASDEDAKKKKKSKMIQIVIGVGLVLFILSDYIVPTEEAEKAPEKSSFKRPERKKPAPAETPAQAAGTTSEVPTEAPTETPTETTTEASGETPTEAPTDTTTEAPSETPTETPVETAPTETPTDVSTETTPDSPVTVTSESAPNEEPSTTEAPTEIDLTGTDTSNISVDSVDGTETAPKGDENLTDQILQDLEKQAKKDQVVKETKKEYVSPPDYEYRGRGLVYNCKGKHWACIDAPSYKICEDNASSVKFLNKKTECHPFNVYETPKGCESMQNRMVSSSAKTNFCND